MDKWGECKKIKQSGGIDYSLIVHHSQQECKEKITPTSKKVRVGRKEMKKAYLRTYNTPPVLVNQENPCHKSKGSFGKKVKVLTRGM